MKSVVLIDDYPVILESFSRIINETSDFKVVGTFTTCEDALVHIKALAPDYILIDITLPGMNGIEGIRHIKTKLPDVTIIVVSVHENSRYVFDALCAGAVGYLTKSGGDEKLIEALHLSASGGSPMSVRIARMVVESFQEQQFSQLTLRENEVLTLLTRGNSYAKIGETLHVSRNTIKYHIRNIYEKLHISSREEAIQLMKDKER